MLNISLELILSARKGEKLGGMKNDGNEEEWKEGGGRRTAVLRQSWIIKQRWKME